MKKIKILTVLVCSLITGINVKAQICNTPASVPPSWLFNPALRSAQSTPTSYTLRVFIHIVRSSSGSGLSSSVESSIVSKLNSDYSGTGIQFLSNGYDFINNNAFYSDLTEAEYSSLYTTNSHSNAIDIYVLGASTNTGSALGYASAIPSTALWIHGSMYNTSVISHEMGHCLGLWHTHHGTVTEYNADGTNPDPAQCPELVNGSNALNCGDYITDTPADPCIWGYNCTYNGSARDANNQAYNPNSANYMAYSTYTCWSQFSPQQRQQMRNFIANTAILQNVVLSSPSHWDYSATMTATYSGFLAEATAANGSGIDQYSWNIFNANTGATVTNSGWNISAYNNEPGKPSMHRVLVTGGSPSSGLRLRVCAHNCAGWGECAPLGNLSNGSYSSFSASPNPASNLLNIEIEAPQPTTANAAPTQQASSTGNASPIALPQLTVYEVKIFNTTTGVMVYQQTMKGTSKQIDVSGLPNGIYTLNISDGSDNPPMTQQIVVAH